MYLDMGGCAALGVMAVWLFCHYCVDGMPCATELEAVWLFRPYCADGMARATALQVVPLQGRE